MKIYRVAILGCRGRGTAAARGYDQHPCTELVGLCDLVPERLDAMGEEFGVPARFDDYHEMIEQTKPDIVAIPTGTEFHYELIMGVLEHGVHIDVEKPMCVDLEQADKLLARAQSQGVRIAVHHQGRTGGHFKAVQRALHEGRIGELRYLLGSGKGYYAGYGLMNIGTHMLNNIIGVAGHCRSVSSTVLTDGCRITPNDVIPAAAGMGYVAGERATASLEFEGNVTGTLLQHRFPKVDSTGYCLEIYGTEGRLFWKSRAAYYLPVPHDVPAGDGQWQALESISAQTYDPDGAADEADYCFADEYVQALDENREHECSGEEARHVIEIIMAIFESAAYGCRVDLPQEDRRHPLLRWREEAGLGLPEPLPRPYYEWLAAEDARLGRVAAAPS